MIREKINNSSNISEAGYENGTLEVLFSSGDVYQYSEVPAEVYLAFAGFFKPGLYFQNNIKGKYSYSKV